MTTSTVQARALADDFVAYRLLTEHDWALWAGDLTHLELWPDVTDQGIQDRLANLADFARRATSVNAAAADDQALVETIAFSGRAKALQLHLQPELEWVNHATGIFPAIFTFLPRYPLITPEHGERYLEKVRRLPDFIDTWRTRLDQGAERGLAPISHLVASLIAALDRHLERRLSEGQLARQAPPSLLTGDQAEVFT
ncbi:MAG: DUF885 family protein, partial [Acidimicrobiia bacterium]